MTKYDVQNPLRGPRIIHGIDGQEIRIEPGASRLNIELDDNVVEELLARRARGERDLLIDEAIPAAPPPRPEHYGASALTAYYDLAVCPPTYDFVSWLLAAEGKRLDLGLACIDVKICPGPADGFRRDSLPPFNVHEREKMRDQIVMPMPRLLPSVRSVERLRAAPTPAQYQLKTAWSYGQRNYSFKFLIEAARRDLYPLRAINPAAVADVTITLRECSYWPTRNSNANTWIEVASRLRKAGRKVAFIRDEAHAAEEVEDFEILPVASVDLWQRAAVYAGAKMNLFVNNGPAWMCLFMGAPCAIFKLTAPNAPCTTDAYFGSHGFKRGDLWPNARPRQFLSWSDDHSADAIMEQLERMP